MNRFRYSGADPFLRGETAIGRWIGNYRKFKVQVDRLGHRWAHFWHTTPRKNWRRIK